MTLLVIAIVAEPRGAVWLSANDVKMPFAVAEPEFATPVTPIVFALSVPLIERDAVEVPPGVANCNVIALPFASRNVLLDMLKVNAPAGPISGDVARGVVKDACARAGVPRVGAHRLRHTAATAMLREGASLPEIAQVLRHREIKTTAVYAKVDRTRLRALAMPWPGSES